MKNCFSEEKKIFMSDQSIRKIKRKAQIQAIIKKKRRKEKQNV